MKSKLSILDKYENKVDELYSYKLSESYWIKDRNLVDKLNTENESMRKSITMSDSTFRRKFDL